MAVTTRIRRPEPRDLKTGRDPDGTARLIHRCRGCESVHQIEVTPDTAIISIGARTCEECLPARPRQARSDAGSAPVKAWWTTTGGAAPHWEIARTTQDGDFQYIKIEPPGAVGPGGGRVDTVAWKQTMIRSGTADWKFLGKMWRPELCATIEALATAIDTMWALITPTARVVIRLAGLPAAAASVLASVVAQLTAQTGNTPVASLGRALRQVGVVACAGTANITSCGPARGLLGELPEHPTEQTAEQLGAPRAIAALAAAVTAPQPLPPGPIIRRDTPQPAARGGLHESRLALLALGEAPARIATFGTP
jgi:hypothetical protein